jgi:flagellar basal body-associated protein FliL
MAEEAKKKPEESKAPAPAADKGHDKKDAAKAGAVGGILAKTPVLLGGAMIIEAAVLFAGFKYLGGGAPQSAAGAELTAEEPSTGGHESKPSDEGKGEGHGGGGAPAPTTVDKKKPVEMQIVDFRAPNKQSGRTFLYDVTIFAVTKGEYKERVEATIKEREALIKDRVRTIIGQMDPEKLGGGSEPGLETLRRQVKYQLDEILGEGMIDEVLVPRCIPFRTDY